MYSWSCFKTIRYPSQRNISRWNLYLATFHAYTIKIGIPVRLHCARTILPSGLCSCRALLPSSSYRGSDFSQFASGQKKRHRPGDAILPSILSGWGSHWSWCNERQGENEYVWESVQTMQRSCVCGAYVVRPSGRRSHVHVRFCSDIKERWEVIPESFKGLQETRTTQNSRRGEGLTTRKIRKRKGRKLTTALAVEANDAKVAAAADPKGERKWQE